MLHEIESLADAFNKVLDEIAHHQRKLKESENNFRAIAENANDGFIVINQRGRFLYANRRAALITDYSVDELIGMKMRDLVVPEVMETIRDKFRTRMKVSEYETIIAGKNGQAVPIEVSTAETPWKGRRAVLVIFRDVSERRLAEEEILRLAYFDVLTNLPNRALLHDRLNQAIAQATRDKRHVGLLFLDLDNFKNINDTMGHGIGDRLLCTIARRLEQSIRNTDTLARLGGDEFVVVLTAINQAEDISLVAKNILTALSVPLNIEGSELYTSASIGIAIFPEDGNNVDTLLKHADLAMYKAKENGRNNFKFFSHDMNKKVTERLLLENNLRNAVERGELFLVYQPQVNLQSGKLVGLESLVRWQHPALGLVPPSRFIPLAEETGLINPIGQWVLRNACQQAMRWNIAGLPAIRVAVNISKRQFAQHDFLESFLAIAAEEGLPTEWLEIELTESAIMSDVKRSANILGELKSAGISISIDDFGTGHSSLGTLKQFPLDRLKIDRSFVNMVHKDSNDGAIAEAIIRMSHSLGLNVVAEGVELKEQHAFLAERGCDEMQGFLLSKPLSTEAAGRFMKNYRVQEKASS